MIRNSTDKGIERGNPAKRGQKVGFVKALDLGEVWRWLGSWGMVRGVLIGSLIGSLGLGVARDKRATSTPPLSKQEQTTTQTGTNLQIVKNIVEEYHKTHTYSGYDLFVCGDMAIDYGPGGEIHGIEILAAREHLGFEEKPEVIIENLKVGST